MQRDRIAGTIWGAALGDAFGLPAEGRDKQILAEAFPPGGPGMPFPYTAQVRGFVPNTWSDDTAQTVLVMRAMAECAGKVDAAPRAFARKIVAWRKGGFPELGETSGEGCGGHTYHVISRPGYIDNPLRTAASIKGATAGNGALMRTAPTAFAEDLSMTIALACATHADPRCAASCVAQVELIRALVGIDEKEAIPPSIVPAAIRSALAAVELSHAHQEDMVTRAKKSTDLIAVGLAERDERGYTLKTFACAVWAVRQLITAPLSLHSQGSLHSAPVRDAALYERCMRQIAAEGADADTNCAVAGAVLGAALGFDGLPKKWVEAVPAAHRKWLDAEIDKYIAAIDPSGKGCVIC